MGKHTIVHVEFPTTDGASSAKFYSELFGWKTQEVPQFSYWMFDTEAGVGGGFNNIGDANNGFEVKPGTVVVYATTDDIEGDLAKAESLGGKIITTKMEIPGMGWYGIFEDPSGNYVGLYTGTEGSDAS
jgi:predicted enzyme related to lactoylglutathione lyase